MNASYGQLILGYCPGCVSLGFEIGSGGRCGRGRLIAAGPSKAVPIYNGCRMGANGYRNFAPKRFY
jgi:hypothetical protein